MYTTVAPRDNYHYRKYVKLAWLDRTIGRWFHMLLFGSAGVLAVIVWLSLRTEPPRPIWPNSPFGMFLALLTLNASLVGPAFLVIAALGVVTSLAGRHARRSGKMVRIHPRVMQAWGLQLTKHVRKSHWKRATRWLILDEPEGLIAENNAWVSSKDPGSRDTWLNGAMHNFALDYAKHHPN